MAERRGHPRKHLNEPRRCQMTVYHSCTVKQVSEYISAGKIKKPVRAWDNPISALKFAGDQHKTVLLTLTFPDDAKILQSHKGQARVIYKDYPLPISEWQVVYRP
jgi:hypothetical protein